MEHVVIIGGGFVGSTVAKRLQDKFKVTLIDTKSYFEFTPGILRTLVHPTRSRCMQVEHKDYLKKSNVLVGSVSRIDFNKKIVYTKKKKVLFDYLVISMGSSYVAPFKHPQLFVTSRARELAMHNKHVVNGKNVLIIGGGLVGVELAGEIGHYYSGKKVAIVSSKIHLLDRMPAQAQKYANNVLRKMSVEVIFGEKVIKHKGGVFFTDKERKLKGDIGFVCTGIIPNTSILRKNGDVLDKNGFIIVKEDLRVKGSENIFAGGDIINISEEKTAQNAENHAKIIAENIIRLEKGKNLSKYTPKRSPLVISLGPRKGIFIWNNFVLTGFIPAVLKWIVEKKEIWKKRI